MEMFGNAFFSLFLRLEPKGGKVRSEAPKQRSRNAQTKTYAGNQTKTNKPKPNTKPYKNQLKISNMQTATASL